MKFSLKPKYLDEDAMTPELTIENWSGKESTSEPVARNLTPLKRYAQQPEIKRIINQIVAAQEEQPFRSIAVLSESSQKEKTLFLSALALGYAQFLRRRVLIMDTVHQTVEDSLYFRSATGHTPNTSLNARIKSGPRVDLLTTRSICSEIEGMCQRETSERKSVNFDVSDFLIGDFLSRQRHFYDLILLDLCPLSETSSATMDPAVLASQTDRVIVHLSAEPLRADQVRMIESVLSDKRVTPLGAVTNFAGIASAKNRSVNQQRAAR